MPLDNPTRLPAVPTVQKRGSVKKSFKRASISAVEMVGQNPNRVGLAFFNTSETSILFLDVDRYVSGSDCLVALVPRAYYELSCDPTTSIWGLWDGLDAGVSIREFIQA